MLAAPLPSRALLGCRLFCIGLPSRAYPQMLLTSCPSQKLLPAVRSRDCWRCRPFACHFSHGSHVFAFCRDQQILVAEHSLPLEPGRCQASVVRDTLPARCPACCQRGGTSTPQDAVLGCCLRHLVSVPTMQCQGSLPSMAAHRQRAALAFPHPEMSIQCNVLHPTLQICAAGSEQGCCSSMHSWHTGTCRTCNSWLPTPPQSPNTGAHC